MNQQTQLKQKDIAEILLVKNFGTFLHNMDTIFHQVEAASQMIRKGLSDYDATMDHLQKAMVQLTTQDVAIDVVEVEKVDKEEK